MLTIQYKKIDELIPYARNSRTHSDAQVAQIAASIKEFGWTNPVLMDGDNGIIAGHGRVLAARVLGHTDIPTIELSHLSDIQKKAYIIADNKLAINAGWDDEVLGLEIAELKEFGFDIDLTGFNAKELKDLFNEKNEINNYSQKVDVPTYEPSAIKPNIKDLYNDEKTFDLIDKIKTSKLPQAEKDFLMLTAGRHVVLNFQLIADYYAHSEKQVQELMEESALIIVDIENAIANGWVNLSEKLNEIYTNDDE